MIGLRRLRLAVVATVVLALGAQACGARFDDGFEGQAGDGTGSGELPQYAGTAGSPQQTQPDDGYAETGDSSSPAAIGGGEATQPAAPRTGQEGEAAPSGPSGAPTAVSVEPGPAPGVTKDEIRIGYLLPITGAAPVPADFDKGVRAYYDEINSTGGLNGRQIRVVIKDTQSQATVGKNRAQELIEQDKVFTVVVLDRLENQKAIGEYLDSRSVPNIQIQTPASLAKDQSWTFGVTIDHAVQGRLIADYFVKVLKAPKVAIVYENTPILHPGRDTFTQQAKALGVEVVYSKAIDGQANDFSSEALGLREAGATATWLYMAPTPAAKLANQADAAGYHPTWFANSISWGFDLIFRVAPKALAGARAFSPWLPLSDPRTKAFQDAYRKHNGEEPNDLGIVGWGVGQIVVEGIKRAGPELGQNSFRHSMQHLDFRPDVWAPLNFAPGTRQGANVVAVLREGGGRWVLERDFVASF